jgi:protein TonB
MTNMVTTNFKSITGGMLTPGGSRRTMQDAGASTWPSLGAHIPAEYISNQRTPMSPALRPMFTTDPLAVKRDKTSSAISFAIHVVAITLVLSLAMKVRTDVTLQPATVVTPLNFKLTAPPMTLPVAKVTGGGGGGGAHEIVEARKGRLPEVAKMQITSPQIIKIDRPKLAVEPTEMVKMPDNSVLPNLGMTQ